MTPVNLDRIQEAIDEGRINPNLPITMKTLRDAKVVNKIEDGVKLLARVNLPATLSLLGTRGKECSNNPSKFTSPERPKKRFKQ